MLILALLLSLSTLIAAIVWIVDATSGAGSAASATAGVITLLSAGLAAWLLVRRARSGSTISKVGFLRGSILAGGITGLLITLVVVLAALSPEPAAVASSVHVPIRGAKSGSSYAENWQILSDATVRTRDFTDVYFTTNRDGEDVPWTITLEEKDGTQIDCRVATYNYTTRIDGSCSDTVAVSDIKDVYVRGD